MWHLIVIRDVVVIAAASSSSPISGGVFDEVSSSDIAVTSARVINYC